LSTTLLQQHTPHPCSLFSSRTPPPPTSTLFPYTTLFRSSPGPCHQHPVDEPAERRGQQGGRHRHADRPPLPDHQPAAQDAGEGGDRKSTRLNSSHVAISYAVFCLKKKKKKTRQNQP